VETIFAYVVRDIREKFWRIFLLWKKEISEKIQLKENFNFYNGMWQ